MAVAGGWYGFHITGAARLHARRDIGIPLILTLMCPYRRRSRSSNRLTPFIGDAFGLSLSYASRAPHPWYAWNGDSASRCCYL